MAKVLSQSQSQPQWQSALLLGAALLTTAAAGLGGVIYAEQTASPSQSFYGIQTDVALKTAMAVSADLGVAFGAIVTAWLWRTGRKGLRKQAILAGVMTAWALLISTGNLSGYFAWVRNQTQVEAVRANPLYALAQADAERAARGQIWLSSADRRILEQGQTLATATREGGDVSKALAVHLLILGFGAAFRLPVPRKYRKAKAVRRAAGKPRLIVSNSIH